VFLKVGLKSANGASPKATKLSSAFTTIKTFAMGTRSRFDGKAARLEFTDPVSLLDQYFPSS
jgi:hypothetical protein